MKINKLLIIIGMIFAISILTNCLNYLYCSVSTHKNAIEIKNTHTHTQSCPL